jgi:hypothetical protein
MIGYLLALLCCGLVLAGQIAHATRTSVWFRDRARRRRLPVAIARRPAQPVPPGTGNVALLGLGYVTVARSNPL